MSEKTTGQVEGVELLARWEGRAEPAPGVLFEKARGDGMLGPGADLLELASWVAVTVISGTVGNAAYDAIKARVLGALTARRRQKGQAELDELKQRVFAEMK